MAVSHRGAISFGLVHIPVGLYTATQDNDIHFNQLCREDGSRIKYKKVCASCGKEVSAKDIVKGFEYDKDKFVIMTDEVKQAPKEPVHPEVNETELTMAKTLINTMVKDFEPSLYKDEYQVKLREIIEQKIAGKDITTSAPEVQVNAIDIMEALKQSLVQAGVNND